MFVSQALPIACLTQKYTEKCKVPQQNPQEEGRKTAIFRLSCDRKCTRRLQTNEPRRLGHDAAKSSFMCGRAPLAGLGGGGDGGEGGGCTCVCAPLQV